MTTTAAPFRALECAIRPEWLSAAISHLSVSSYLMLFNDAARNFFANIGLDDTYLVTHEQFYVVGNVQIRYEREIFGGELAQIDVILVDADEKRAHIALEMFRAGEPRRLCFAEMLLVSFGRAAGGAVPWAGDISARLAALKTKHEALPRPRGLGQNIGIKRV